MPRGGNRNPIGYNQITGPKPHTFGPQLPFGLSFDFTALRRIAVKFGQERAQANSALYDAHTRLAFWAQRHMLDALQEQVAAGGRPQKFGSVRTGHAQGNLEKALLNPSNARVTVAGFGVGSPDWLSDPRSLVGAYWRQVEEGGSKVRTVEGLFGLPPLAGGRASRLEGPKSGSRSAVKFAEFNNGKHATVQIRVGPEKPYGYLKEGARRAKAEYRRSALGVYKESFRAFRLDFMARMATGNGAQPSKFGDLFISNQP